MVFKLPFLEPLCFCRAGFGSLMGAILVPFWRIVLAKMNLCKLAKTNEKIAIFRDLALPKGANLAPLLRHVIRHTTSGPAEATYITFVAILGSHMDSI